MTAVGVSFVLAGLALGAMEGADAGAPEKAPQRALGAGTPEREAVRQVVRGHLPELRACYEAERARTRATDAGTTPAGSLKVRWTIGRDGVVESVEALNVLPGASEAFAGCMTDSIRGWHFPPPTAGERAVVTYPFVFSGPTDAGQP